MRRPTKAILAAAGALVLTAGNASAAVVCNDDGDCWHVQGRPDYKPELRLHIHPNNWKWSQSDHYKWREHAGRGYWRGGVWIDL
jgi:hypothetical protein